MDGVLKNEGATRIGCSSNGGGSSSSSNESGSTCSSRTGNGYGDSINVPCSHRSNNSVPLTDMFADGIRNSNNSGNKTGSSNVQLPVKGASTSTKLLPLGEGSTGRISYDSIGRSSNNSIGQRITLS